MENSLSVGSSLPSDERRIETQEASHKAIETKVDNVYQAMNPSIEAVPGEKPATPEEKEIRDITLEERALDRAKVLEEIRKSPTFRLQKLYFAAQSTYDEEIDSFLGWSWPDLQIEEYLQDIENFERDESLDASERAVLQDVEQRSQEALKQARYFSSIVLEPDASTKEKYRKESTEKLQKTLNDLPAQGKMLIPAGYFRGECHDIHGFLEGEVLGHTIELEFTKIETEENTIEYRCVVLNTGEGLDDYHTKTKEEFLGVETVVFLPVVYRIPSDQIESFIEQACLFSSLEKKKDRSAMNEFYALLEKTGKREFKEEGKYHAYKRQAVSNCTQESYDVWLRQQCSEKDGLYEKFSAHRAQTILQESEQFVSMPTITVEHQMIREKESPLQDLSDKVARSTSFFLTGKSFTKTYTCEELKIKDMVKGLILKTCKGNAQLAKDYVEKYGMNEEFLLETIQQNADIIKLFPEKIEDDSFIAQAIEKNMKVFDVLTDEKKKEKALALVKKRSEVFPKLPSELRKNKDFLLQAVKEKGSILKSALKFIQEDQIELDKNALILAAVSSDGTALNDVPKEDQTEEVILAAVTCNGSAIIHSVLSNCA